ncbi:hypothetical protein N9878_00350 [bacterium]|nr:hypothetical protein [bacterium]
MQTLTGKAVNYSVRDTYQDGDQRQFEGRIPEVGTRAVFEDGREYIFASTNVDLSIGRVAAQIGSVEAVASGTTLYGVPEVKVELAGIQENEYAGGYLSLPFGDISYKVKSNSAADGSDIATFVLEEVPYTAVANNEPLRLSKSRSSDVVLGTATNLGVGVTVSESTAGTDLTTTYLWLQTCGVGGVLVSVGATAINGAALMQTAAGAMVVQTSGKMQLAQSIESASVGDGGVAAVVLNFPS